MQLVRVPERQGKGAALRTGIATALEHEPEAVLLIDADGQHPAESIGALYAAAGELVIGIVRSQSMPVHRRSQPGQPQRPAACDGAPRARHAVRHAAPAGTSLELPLRGDGYEAQSRQLKAALVHGLDVTWVPIPAIYADERSLLGRSSATLRSFSLR